MFPQEREELGLIVEFPMMLMLPKDVGDRVRHLRFADRKCPISFLPSKAGHVLLIVHPAEISIVPDGTLCSWLMSTRDSGVSGTR